MRQTSQAQTPARLQSVHMNITADTVTKCIGGWGCSVGWMDVCACTMICEYPHKRTRKFDTVTTATHTQSTATFPTMAAESKPTFTKAIVSWSCVRALRQFRRDLAPRLVEQKRNGPHGSECAHSEPRGPGQTERTHSRHHDVALTITFDGRRATVKARHTGLRHLQHGRWCACVYV